MSGSDSNGDDLSGGTLSTRDREFANYRLTDERNRVEQRSSGFALVVLVGLLTWIAAIALMVGILLTGNVSTHTTVLVSVTFSVSVVMLLTALKVAYAGNRRGREAEDDDEWSGPAALELLKRIADLVKSASPGR